MAERAVDFVLKRLQEWGVHRIYGYPGDGINGFLGAFNRAAGDPEFIQTRHEEMAARKQEEFEATSDEAWQRRLDFIAARR